eukprot:CAMPEP_0174384976 /NCGR_PEP_ID=MMETSP0811_2-20130205/126271_1 /TAXON_ID=73025 ORGANISM="Eutreptiella gymnastica-like, Strain CCMP1594" /NCGR_SAMPLE_ID=MMETSP0811_2 /ASSEMBLY_ACC=CAM_ASM_000667 /LENGTH=178 /DNA_ID=CAMNT_0015539117 /DNA_START=1588 /DNA_END=2121 /DNA_ORIENTATION=-
MRPANLCLCDPPGPMVPLPPSSPRAFDGAVVPLRCRGPPRVRGPAPPKLHNAMGHASVPLGPWLLCTWAFTHWSVMPHQRALLCRGPRHAPVPAATAPGRHLPAGVECTGAWPWPLSCALRSVPLPPSCVGVPGRCSPSCGLRPAVMCPGARLHRFRIWGRPVLGPWVWPMGAVAFGR